MPAAFAKYVKPGEAVNVDKRLAPPPPPWPFPWPDPRARIKPGDWWATRTPEGWNLIVWK